MIYLDYAATHPVYSDIVHNLHDIINKYYYNPSSLYEPAVKTKAFYENQRIKIAEFLGVNEKQIIFTSSATEGANLIIKGLNYKNRNKVVLWSAEHACVFKSVLNHNEIEHCFLKNPEGFVTYEDIEPFIDKKTKLVCLMHVNNETGAINEIDDIAKKIKDVDKEILIFTDIVQSFAKIPVNFKYIDFATFSSHKIGGLRGGAGVYIKDKNLLKPLIDGGGQESNLRSGTENVIAVYSMAKAMEVTKDIYAAKQKHLISLNNYMREYCSDRKFPINSPEKAVPYIFNFSTKILPSEVVINGLSEKGIYVSNGSACSGKSHDAGRILKSMDLDEEVINTSIRISIHPSTKLSDLKDFFKGLEEILSLYK
jgi:cysteine desulfurase